MNTLVIQNYSVIRYSKINPTISNDQQMYVGYIIIDLIMEDNNQDKVNKCDKG